jgi:hypothetical protein
MPSTGALHRKPEWDLSGSPPPTRDRLAEIPKSSTPSVLLNVTRDPRLLGRALQYVSRAKKRSFASHGDAT